MKIAITSDIHYPVSTEQQVSDLAISIRERNPDIVAILGDIGEVYLGHDTFKNCLSIFDRHIPNVPKLILPGNHDLWTKDSDSLELLNKILPEIVNSFGMHWLESYNYLLHGFAFVGSYLHYDYSAKDKVGVTAGYTDEWFRDNKNNTINDHLMKGVPDDITFAGQLGTKFRERLLEAQNSDAHGIIVLSHVPCLDRQVTRRPHDFRWSVSTPYFGNLAHEELIMSCSKVRLVVSGHSHRGHHSRIDLGNRSIEVANMDSDYRALTFKEFEV